MKVIVTAVALLLAGAAHAQTPPAPTTSVPGPAPTVGLTRDLNSGPPAPATYLAPAPAPVVAPVPSTAAVSPPTVRPVPASGSTAPVATAPVRATPVPIAPGPQPRPAPVIAPTATPAPSVAAAPVSAPAASQPAATTPVTPPPAAAPAVTVLDGPARAALPFTVELPTGFEIVTGRPGPNFRIYTIRRGPQTFVMVYAGPASQFPIYSGQMVEAGGRASILSTEDGVRHAVEHLFQRSTTPNEIHIWTASLDGTDRDLAEQIAQSVDVR